MRAAVALFGLFTLGACGVPTKEHVASEHEETRCLWSWAKLGAVRGLAEPVASGDGVLAPALIDDGDVLRLWYTQKTGTRHAMMYAESTDGGASFGSPRQVTGIGEAMNAYPSIRREDGIYKLLFGSGSIKEATSKDGIHFTLGTSVLSASFVADRFDALSVLYPSRVDDVLFFTGYDGTRVRIGRAIRRDGAYVVDPPHPIVDIGAPADFDNSATAQPHVQRAAGTWWMWYGGYDTSHSNPGPYRIGAASSADGVTWTKHGVAIELSNAGTDAWSTRDAFVLPKSRSTKHWRMFYVGMGDDARYRLHRAVSDSGCNTL